MKKYFINYWNNFSNTFNLIYVESDEDKKSFKELNNFTPITLKEAKHKITVEKEARKNDPAFAFYGTIEIISATDYLKLTKEFK
jgi:site-specific DNA-adenine methylase